MHILLTNDDGYNAPGIVALYNALKDYADVTIVAPKENQSGKSHSITLLHEFKVGKVNDHIYWVDGTPADCVKLVRNGFLEDTVDLVISGINQGPNLGFDIIYSGTVGAAREAQDAGIPAIAVSVTEFTNPDYSAAAAFVKHVVEVYPRLGIGAETLLNINVPNTELTGIEITQLCARHYKERYELVAPNTYKLRLNDKSVVLEPGTDAYATSQGRVSITPLHTDFSCSSTLGRGDEILEHILIEEKIK